MNTLTINLPLVGSVTLVRFPAQFAMPLHSEKLTYANRAREYRVAWGRHEMYLTPWPAVKEERRLG
ncbi:hypothetical protein [Nioella sediminis]|uniref:hypothetical protein n=1 Tax=Nioella sediminis TaxID=1912092 RepID=UPI0008FD3C83|nr:hypothetical protein [Nioella sediminis]TBX29100.1 hypothetical protein TK43_02035 [Roseovarius sp. JS7-11]